ncbi:hypothetical protein ACFPL7_22345 [Dongia soli]|uniref:Uncharacterized protein n=1 Tax=Dongia soli TaxID=600628 RepID=A0ABU5E7S7_9PROT|nr:hypothetical protein [Dongia soli]MDY0882332.1 hypothetical protein [Dongia soli]
MVSMAKSDPYRAAAKAAKALLDVIGATGDIPKEFWESPFVLGFFFYYLHAVAVRAGEEPGNYKNMPLAYVLACGEPLGIDVLQRTLDFSTLRTPDYLTGLDAGDKYLAVVYGSKTYDNDPAIIEARRMARQTAMDLKDPNIELVDIENTYLLETVFLSEVRRRLNLVTIN